MSNLVIVESPTKAKTLAKILDKKYMISASMGHIRDLPKKGLGVDVEHEFKPEYEIPIKAKKIVTELKKAVKTVDAVILATDPDREGEAIAWHLKNILTSVKEGKNKKYNRVVFHELTKEAVLLAFSRPGEINDNLVDSQQARRILDRLVGYKLSPLLWKKVRYGLSAGRVQSVAVRLVVERERERTVFKPQEYWTLDADFASTEQKTKKVTATLDKKSTKKIDLANEQKTMEIVKDLQSDQFKVAEVTKSERQKRPKPPYKTSTLQQEMANMYGFSAGRTMKAAQALFEQGLITYHRTDSLSLAPQFLSTARDFVKKEFGANYLPLGAQVYKTSAKNAQEAHEAIRPTNVNLSPKSAQGKALTGDVKKAYTIIWKRAIECQILPAIYDQTVLKILSQKEYEFKATGSIVKFDGWLVVGKSLGFSDDEELKVFPEFAQGEKLNLLKLAPLQHFTQPPARYSDATLISKLEELGIGRPSTYAPTLSTIQQRGYVEKDGRYYKPTDVAFVVTDLLVAHFPNVIDYDFTAHLEEDLDAIAEGQKKWVPVIKEFYDPFEKELAVKDKELSKRDVTNLGETGEKCPKCGFNLVIKLGKYGKFLSCSNYPECDYASPIAEKIDENGETLMSIADVEDFGKCDKCEDGHFIVKQGRFGKFLACINYPKCKNTKPYLDKIGMKCPKCGDGEVIVKKSKWKTFYGCSRYPECDYASWKNPMPSENSQVD